MKNEEKIEWCPRCEKKVDTNTHECFDNPWTTIRITKETRQRILQLGHKGETDDEIIQKLLKGADYLRKYMGR